jgi:hypothetical protein
MKDYKQKGKLAPSRLMKGFGAVSAKEKEDYRLVRAEMEEAVAEEVAAEDLKN